MIKAKELEFGEQYKMDSQLGGVFSIMYMGTNTDNDHIFIITTRGWERSFCWTDEQVERLVMS